MPAILEKIVQWLLPYIINYAQKHIPEVLDYMVKSAKDKYNEFMKEGQDMSAKVIMTLTNEKTNAPIAGAKVIYRVGAITSDGVSNTDGVFAVSGLVEGANEFNISAAGYTDKKFQCTLISGDNTVSVPLTANVVAPAVQQATSPADIVSGIVASYVFNPPTSIDDAKKQYNDLLENIKSQKGVIVAALSTSSLAVLQEQAANLLYTVKKSFQPAMDYYVTERSKLNEFRDFFKWIEYTGMIGGIYFARYSALKYITELETKIASMLSA